MSVHAIKWAWSQQVGNPTRKLVLVALADHANSDGECWPALKTVAEFAECEQRTVQRHIDALQDGGFIKREGRRPRPGGRFSRRTYRLLMTTTGQLESTGHDSPADDMTNGHERPMDTPAESDCPMDTGDAVQWTLVSSKEPTTEPSTSPDGEAAASRESFTDRCERWLTDQGIKLPDTDRQVERRKAILGCALDEAGRDVNRARSASMGIICDYIAHLTGNKVGRECRELISRLVGEFGGGDCLDAAERAMTGGAGLDPKHRDDPLAVGKFMSAVLHGHGSKEAS